MKKYTVKEINGRFNPRRIYRTYEEAAEAAWLDNMSSGATHAVYEVRDNGDKVELIKVKH